MAPYKQPDPISEGWAVYTERITMKKLFEKFKKKFMFLNKRTTEDVVPEIKEEVKPKKPKKPKK